MKERGAGLRVKKSEAKGGGATWFRPNTKKIRFRVFSGCRKFFSFKNCFMLIFFYCVLCVWLDIHLYKKFLYVLFKKILQ
jgi:hypothetical protein